MLGAFLLLSWVPASAAQEVPAEDFFASLLQRWVSGQPAVDELLEERQRWVTSRSTQPAAATPALRAYEKLASGEPRVTLAILAFELAAHRRQLDGPPVDLGPDPGFETRRYLRWLADLLRQQIRSRPLADLNPRQSQRLTAQLWASVAFDLRAARRDAEARQWLLEAVLLDPQQLAARLTLAALEEKRGDYRLVRLHLGRALKGHPDDPESRLRLALVDARQDKTRKALEGLEGLTAEGNPPWIRSVAFQEWAQLLAAQGQGQRAVEQLLRARRLFPRDPALAVELLYFSPERSELSTELIESLQRTADWSHSGRLVYNLWPLVLEEQDRLLRAQLESHRPTLGAVVDQKLLALRAAGADSARARSPEAPAGKP